MTIPMLIIIIIITQYDILLPVCAHVFLFPFTKRFSVFLSVLPAGCLRDVLSCAQPHRAYTGRNRFSPNGPPCICALPCPTWKRKTWSFRIPAEDVDCTRLFSNGHDHTVFKRNIPQMRTALETKIGWKTDCVFHDFTGLIFSIFVVVWSI